MLVRGAVALAKGLKIPPIIIGLTVVALGTSAPELVVSVNAAISGHYDIAVGNIIGSNISNILLVLGISALVHPITVEERLKKFDSAILALAAIIFGFFAYNGMLESYEGIILLSILVFYNYALFRATRKNRTKLHEHNIEEAESLIQIDNKIPLSIALTVGGTALLIYGADILVIGAVDFAKIMGMSEGVVGLTIVAIGSSAPELAACVIAACHKHSDVAIGNIVGSNILNIFAGMGLAASLSPIEVNPQFLKYDLWVMIGATLLLIFFMKKFGEINRFKGGLFFVLYIAYISSQFIEL